MYSNVIAIDGPAASGKSSVAKQLAQRLGIAYISTGAMYRALAWKLLTTGKDVNTISSAELTDFLAKTELTCRSAAQGVPFEVEIDGERPGAALHTPEVSAGASKVATYPEIRAWLLEVQRKMAGEHRIVMEGRDIGTAIFPDALHKFFLTASPEVRAERRLKQDGSSLDPASLAKVAADIAARDEQDRTRKLAPLKQAEDALFIDNSTMNLEETVQFIADAVHQKDVAHARKTVLRYRVPYGDTDQMGVVYYGNYFKYFEMFRTEFMLAAGASYQTMEDAGFSLPVIEAHCNYKAPAHFEEIIEITGCVAECKGVRCKIFCQIHCKGKLLVEGYTVHACLGKDKRPVKVPALIADLMEK